MYGSRQGAEGKQLLLEAVAGLGALLLALERRIPGPSRERAVVAHLRRRGGAQVLLLVAFLGLGFQVTHRASARRHAPAPARRRADDLAMLLFLH